jgi:hypothetical protein
MGENVDVDLERVDRIEMMTNINLSYAGVAQLGEQQTEEMAFWRSRVQSTVLASFLCIQIAIFPLLVQSSSTNNHAITQIAP